MEAAATASLVQSSIAAIRPSNSIGRSGNLAANGPAGFLRLSPGFHFSIKVLFFGLGIWFPIAVSNMLGRFGVLGLYNTHDPECVARNKLIW